jgi:hypothetical protein
VQADDETESFEMGPANPTGRFGRMRVIGIRVGVGDEGSVEVIGLIVPHRVATLPSDSSGPGPVDVQRGEAIDRVEFGGSSDEWIVERGSVGIDRDLLVIETGEVDDPELGGLMGE